MHIFCDSHSCKANDFITNERLQMLDQTVLTIHNLICNSMRHRMELRSEQGNCVYHLFFL